MFLARPRGGRPRGGGHFVTARFANWRGATKSNPKLKRWPQLWFVDALPKVTKLTWTLASGAVRATTGPSAA